MAPASVIVRWLLVALAVEHGTTLEPFSMLGTEWTAPSQGGRTLVSSSRVVSTRKGSVRGLYLVFDDKQMAPVEVYLGVPYASPPVGSLRFMPPVTVSPWRGIRQADRYSSVCPQHFPDIRNETEALKRMPRGRLETLKKLEPLLTNQSEDCLYLNIFTPYTNSFAAGSASYRPRYPVIVFLHGQSYSWGSGNTYDGSVLASVGKVVVVTLNYRLGVLGFLNPHSDPYSRSISNHGLMDQIAALHWLQENVAEFGGDPNSVTLMGHGTGAACATFLMTSPAVLDGLFQRAILLSGTALSPWALIQEPTKYAQEVARHANCSSADAPASLLKCLRERPLSALMSSWSRVEAPEFLHAFGPSIDGIVVEDEYEANRKKLSHRLARYDLMFGVTQVESYFALSADDIHHGMQADRRNRFLRTFVRNTYQFHLQEILATIINEYTDWEKAVLHPLNIRDETLEALSDAQYVAPLVKTADLHGTPQHSAFFYVFEYPTRASEFSQRTYLVHEEELAFIFGAPLVQSLGHFERNFSKGDAALSETVIAYWTNFARTGNPNEAGITNQYASGGGVAASQAKDDKSKSRLEWPVYDQQHRKFLSIGQKLKAKSHYRSHKLATWTNLIPDLHRATAGEEVARVHHLLDDYNDPDSYEGKVRQVPATLAPAPTSTTPQPMTSAVNSSLPIVGTSRGARDDEPYAKVLNGTRGLTGAGHGKSSDMDHYSAYSTALSVTIAIGCSLLILNVLIFAGVYYQRDKQRMELKRRLENGMMLSASVSGEVEQQHTGGAMSARLCDKPDLANSASMHKIDSNSSMRNAGSAAAAAAAAAGHGVASSSVLSLNSPFSASIAQLPPPEFADFPPPPPPDHHHHHHHHQAAGIVTTIVPGGSSNNGRAAMISSASVSFRPSGTGTLPRPASTCANEPLTGAAASQSQQRTSSLKKKPNVRAAGAIDELRV